MSTNPASKASDRLPFFFLILAIGSLGAEVWALVRALALLLGR